MSYIRKSFQDRSGYLVEDDKPSYMPSHHISYNQHKAQYSKGRYTSNQKKYDYQTQINDISHGRPRTPSASQFNKHKYQQNMANTLNQNQFSGGISHGKLKKIAKNYASGLGNNNFSDFNHISEKNNKNKFISIKDDNLIQPSDIQRKQNINSRNMQNRRQLTQTRQTKDRSFAKKYKQQEIKDSFQRINEERIFQKIDRINKLNSQINGRLQKILSKVTVQQ